MMTLAEYFHKKLNESKDTIDNEQDFREYARNKFEEVFGSALDEERMKMTIKGLLDDNKELVDANKWGELVGILNQSFAK